MPQRPIFIYFIGAIILILAGIFIIRYNDIVFTPDASFGTPPPLRSLTPPQKPGELLTTLAWATPVTGTDNTTVKPARPQSVPLIGASAALTPTAPHDVTSGGAPLVSIGASVSDTAKAVTSETSAPVLYKRFEGMLDNIHDRSRLQQDEPYNALLKYVSKLAFEEITAKVNPKVTYHDLMFEPEKYRAEFIRVKGVILYLNPYRLKTNPSGVEIFYEGMVGNPSSNEVYRFHVSERPEAFKTFDEVGSRADEAMVEGAFLKVISYELAPLVQAARGKTYNDVPFIIGRRLTKVEKVPDPAAKQFAYVAGLAVVVALAVLAVALFISAKRSTRRGAPPRTGTGVRRPPSLWK